ncbi:MAG: glycosyltransferase family 1 protein [Opitutales bacterium]|nr:glycosyltransferase family 1 protein [Opitutales bacterium]
MKIALVTETYPPEINGVAMTLGQLTRGWADRGYQVEVVTPARKDRNWQENLDISLVEVPGLPIPRYSELRFGLPCVFRLQRLWQDLRPEWVHIATEGPLGWSAFQVARDLDIPVVSSYHTHFDQYGSHYGYGVIQMAVLGWMRSLHNQAALTFVPAEALLTELSAKGFKGLRLMGRGVDTQRFSPQRRDPELRRTWGAAETAPVALYVGRVAPEKNLRLVFDSFERMLAVRSDAKLVVVGDGPELEKWQRMYPNVHFCGRRTGVNLARYYASADCFLFSSQSETFGNVVTEAMASRLLVFAYDYAAAGKYIRHAENGLLAPFGDTQSYLRNIELWAQRYDAWPKLRKAARETTLSISWDVVVDSYLDAVNQSLHYQPTSVS